MKKITPQVRRRMLLDVDERGLSEKELRDKYHIKDNRTLRKHLALAEQEREMKEARLRILTESQADHLTDIRSLIEEWRSQEERGPEPQIEVGHIRIPDFPVESKELFQLLPQHLPNRAFWTSFEAWRHSRAAYNAQAPALLGQIESETKTQMAALPARGGDVGLRESGFAASAFQLAARLALGGQVDLAHIYEETPAAQGQLALSCQGIAIAQGVAPYLADRRQIHEAMVKSYAQGETMKNLLERVVALRAFHREILPFLTRALLSRSYIHYSCGFCPAALPRGKGHRP